MKHSPVIWSAIFVILLAFGSLPACSPSPAANRITVVSTSNIVADWISRIGGDRVEVFSLLKPGTDPHTFQPGAADVARVARARLIFSVGLGLEGRWLTQLLTNAAADPNRLVTLGDYIDPIPGVHDHEENGEEHEEEHSIFDPHFWWDPLRVERAVDEIARRLSETDVAGAETYSNNHSIYTQELKALHLRIVERTSQIPPQRRILVTSHETMNYFAERYGFRVAGSVFHGISTHAEPSAAQMAQLSRTIRDLAVPVIFAETTVNDRLAKAVAGETGARVIRLYTDSLGPRGGTADTYIRMMDSNVQTIVRTLK